MFYTCLIYLDKIKSTKFDQSIRDIFLIFTILSFIEIDKNLSIPIAMFDVVNLMKSKLQYNKPILMVVVESSMMFLLLQMMKYHKFRNIHLRQR